MRKVQKLLSKKNGLSNSETFKFLSAVSKNTIGLNAERYRMILDCGFEETEEKNPAPFFCPKPVGEVVGFPKDWKLLGKGEMEIKK